MGARLPTYRLTTRNSALIAAWLVVIEYKLHKSGLRIRMPGPLGQLQQRSRRPPAGLSTLAAAETAGQVVDESGRRMAQRGHVDVAGGFAAGAFDLEPAIGVVDVAGEHHDVEVDAPRHV